MRSLLTVFLAASVVVVLLVDAASASGRGGERPPLVPISAPTAADGR